MKFMRAAPVIVFLVAACGGSDAGPSTSPAVEPAVEQPDGESASTEPTDEPTGTDATDSEVTDTEVTDAEVAVAEISVAGDTTPENEEVLAPIARPDPCSLWTASELEGATGLPFLDGEFNDQLSVNGQEICDWIASGDAIANAQVLVLAPGLDYDFLRAGTEAAAGPATDIEVFGADAAHVSVDGRIIGIGIGDVIVQLAYLPPTGAADTAPQLRKLAAVAAARISGVEAG